MVQDLLVYKVNMCDWSSEGQLYCWSTILFFYAQKPRKHIMPLFEAGSYSTFHPSAVFIWGAAPPLCRPLDDGRHFVRAPARPSYFHPTDFDSRSIRKRRRANHFVSAFIGDEKSTGINIYIYTIEALINRAYVEFKMIWKRISI